MKAILLASACAGALVTFMPAQAQTDTSDVARPRPGSEEIVVTATRRPEKLQDVPLSVTAFTQADLTSKGIVGYEGLARETPGVVLNKPSANFNNFTARGVATNGYGANLQSTVAVYIDELPISTIGNTTVIDPNLFDVERVEFLRGPQGTLFGSGSLSGALRILTKGPDLTAFHASALVDLGLTGSDSLRQRYNLMANVPLVEDQLGIRVVGFFRHEDGYLDNVGTGIHNSNTLIDRGGRANLLWKANDRLSVKLLFSRENSNPEDSSLISPSLGGRDKRISDRPDLFTGKLTSYNATINYQFDGAHLTSSSTYSKFDQRFFVDLAGTFNQAIAFGLDAYGYQKTMVEEVRLASDPGGPIDWVLGGFYLGRRLDVDYFYRSSPQFLLSRGITGLPDEYYQKQYTHINSHEVAGFGELTWHVTDKFWLTAGMRYGTVDAKGFTEGGYNSNYLTNALVGIRGPLAVTPIANATGVTAEGTKPSYKFSASFKPWSELTTYATYATGFRTPVVNAFGGRGSVVNANDLIIPNGASSDNLKNYEVGAKARLFDGKLILNLAAYYIDWSNIQVQANRVSDSVQFVTNIGAAESKGVELEMLTFPVSGLTFGVNASINDAKVTKLSPQEAAISGAVQGARLAFPRFQGSVYADYGFDLTGSLRANASIAFQHVGSFPGSFPNVPGQPGVVATTYASTESYNNVNAAFAVSFDRMTIGAYVENLFNDHSITYVHPEAFLASRFGTMRPRTVGVRMGYDF